MEFDKAKRLSWFEKPPAVLAPIAEKKSFDSGLAVVEPTQLPYGFAREEWLGVEYWLGIEYCPELSGGKGGGNVDGD